MNTYIMPTGFGWEPFRTLDNDERLAAWATKYFSAGHHRRPRTNSTAMNPQASDTAAKRQDGTLSKPLIPCRPGSAFAEAGLIRNTEKSQ